MIDFTCVDIKFKDHVIKAELCEAEAKQPPGAVLIHGWTAPKNYCRRLAARLALAGFTCIMPEMRGHGETGGVIGKDAYKDAIAAAEWLLNSGKIDPERLGIAGVSMGGITSLETACKFKKIGAVAVVCPDIGVRTLAQQPFIRGLFERYAKVMRGEPDTLQDDWHDAFLTKREIIERIVPERFNELAVQGKLTLDEALAYFDDVDPFNHPEELTQPTLILANEKDEWPPLETLTKFYNSLQGAKKMIIFKDNPHTYEDEFMGPLILAWFRMHL